jgi:hypothetical protein
MNKQELEEKIRVRCELDKERQLSNELYAKIITERIVFGLVALITIAFITSVIRVIWK